MTIIRKQADIAEASNADLVETYNALLGKSIKKFESRAIAEVKVANAILAAENAAGHAGVPKGSKPEAKTVEELAFASATPEASTDAQPEKEQNVSTTNTAAAADDKASIRAKRYPIAEAQEAARKAKTAAKKAGGKPVAKKASKAAPAKGKAQASAKKPSAGGKKPSAGQDRKATYTKVRLTEPSTPRRPQEGSNRSKVLDALKKRKEATIDQLSKDVGFDARPYVHKLVFQEWAEVMGE